MKKLQRIRSTKLAMCDVDETLVIVEHIPPGTPRNKLIKFKNKRGVWCYGLPHEAHIKLLRQFAARGFTMIAWSAGGEDWAYYMVKLLKLMKIIDFTMGKPDWYIDDKPASKFMKGRIYIDTYGIFPRKTKRA